ncbi:hypothetical protein TNCV_3831311 [Trichonephila clavipes]|nr:hypothetical protein TNCV_3831311 [Trichonephila clavipes]
MRACGGVQRIELGRARYSGHPPNHTKNPGWAFRRPRTTGRPPRQFGVTVRSLAVSNYIRKYSRLADSTQTNSSTDYNPEN